MILWALHFSYCQPEDVGRVSDICRVLGASFRGQCGGYQAGTGRTDSPEQGPSWFSVYLSKVSRGVYLPVQTCVAPGSLSFAFGVKAEALGPGVVTGEM